MATTAPTTSAAAVNAMILPSRVPQTSPGEASSNPRQFLGEVFSSVMAPGLAELGYTDEEFEKRFEQEFEKELELEFGSRKRKAGAAVAQDDKGESDDEEDDTLAEKRRRNTAASARFRLKKKMKEQRLEAMAKLMTDRAQTLQQKVDELEAEVGYLRDLVTLRRDQRVTDFVQL